MHHTVSFFPDENTKDTAISTVDHNNSNTAKDYEHDPSYGTMAKISTIAT
jgi:hypothetical protein